MSESMLSKVIVGVSSALATAFAFWGLGKAGGFFTQILVPDLPGGAVVAFTGACPEGWEIFPDAEGRFIVGVGKGPLHKPVYLKEPGGSDTVELTYEEVPPHNHKTGVVAAHGITLSTPKEGSGGAWIPYYIDGASYVDEGETDGVVFYAGGGQDGKARAHNNMPPFVALFYCTRIASNTTAAPKVSVGE